MDEKKLYIDFCTENFGREPDTVHRWEAENPEGTPIDLFIWNDQPEVGLVTAVTYGLSSAGHDEWYIGRPELMVRVESEDPAWPLSIAYLAEVGRGEIVFEYGTVIGLDEPIAEDSSMTSFFIFAPPLMEGEEMSCEVGDELPIQLTGCYPIYTDEGPLVSENFDEFWNRDDYDIFSVTRPEFRR